MTKLPTVEVAIGPRVFFPTVRPRVYRWRARAKVGATWGAWSAHASFTLS